MKKKRRVKRDFRGFTLIELIVVIGILAVLTIAVLSAINPTEHLQKANDTTTENIANDFIAANGAYYASFKVFPWEKNANCMNELNQGGTLDQMTDCINEMKQGGALRKGYDGTSQLNKIYVTKCGNTAVLCYNPRSKAVNQSAETKYTKFGVNDPGCPGGQGVSTQCYWCKPLHDDPSCTTVPTPTLPSPSTTPGSSTMAPTATATPASLPPTPTVEQAQVFPQLVPGYANDQSKFFKTYAVYFFDYPGFPPPPGGWDTHLSLRSDFGGDWTETNKSFGIPSPYGPGTGTTNTSYTAYRKITQKYVGFASTPSNTGVYSLSNCGKTLYYRIANYYNDSATDKQVGPTYTATFDCTTKVGVVDPPLSWYTVYDQANGRQKQYDRSWDFDNSGAIDWVDYWLGAFSTKTRYGGWGGPE